MNAWMRLSVALVLVVWSTHAHAMHREDIPALTRLAHELEGRAAHVHRAAEAQAHHFTGREARMFRSLQRFHLDAGRFHRGLETYLSSPLQVEDAIEDLNDGADRIESVIYRSHAVSHVIDDWNRCAFLLRQINRYFDGGDVRAFEGADGKHR